ncbi:MAG: hypothetical protein EPO19_10425 [Betaproteobacteria bacterium]|nr:MAG: hypothetical protein EPO19_10425 [Betaproteobacteria bacterium]
MRLDRPSPRSVPMVNFVTLTGGDCSRIHPAAADQDCQGVEGCNRIYPDFFNRRTSSWLLSFSLQTASHGVAQ